MPEHVHQWGIVDSWPDRDEKLHAECFWGWKESDYKQQCSATLDDDEIDRRLNATERLSAENARSLVEAIFPPEVFRPTNVDIARQDRLLAYAAELEKD